MNVLYNKEDRDCFSQSFSQGLKYYEFRILYFFCLILGNIRISSSLGNMLQSQEPN